MSELPTKIATGFGSTMPEVKARPAAYTTSPQPQKRRPGESLSPRAAARHRAPSSTCTLRSARMRNCARGMAGPGQAAATTRISIR